MTKDTSVSNVESQEELEQLRTIVLGEDHHLISDKINEQARQVVGDVLTEALHDRQKFDGSVNKVLLPIVEHSVEHSVTHHSDRLIGSLYPLMGSLVRKSVGAFLTDFIDKTNQLIEHSFTIKGLKWRFKAWQAGISFTQFVVSQTYNYRVEHVLLIHQETGLLLKSINLDQQSKNDTDLISSMLSAINDFVKDSFQLSKEGLEEQLQTISTDNFNLLIKPGPKAIIVAAVTGTPPQKVSDQLQVTLEDIHRLFMDELIKFNGDNSTFENAENQLRDCLLTEEKKTDSAKIKKPWFAWTLIFFLTIFSGAWVHNWYQKEQLAEKIMLIDQQPGIVVQNVDVRKINSIYLDIMRDPDAISVDKWLNERQLPVQYINVNERKYRSLADKIIKARARNIISKYVTLSHKWHQNNLELIGKITNHQYQELTASLSIAGITASQINAQQVNRVNSNSLVEKADINRQVFESLIGKISTIQLSFDTGSNTVTTEMHSELTLLVNHFLHLKQLATKLNLSVGLIIMGSSDNSGNRITNNQLSMQRAESTANALTTFGIDKTQMFITGLGQVDIKDVKYTARKVMFNIMYVESSQSN